MKCTNKEQETCQVEKRGCEGCAYNEKSADEMFAELGYEKTKSEQSETFELGDNIIKFWLWAMNVQVFTKNQIICIKELQAINKKVQELGWKG